MYPCLDKDGLFYETYIYRPTEGTPTEAVIAFRGTENYPFSQAIADWKANPWAALGIEPSQYRIARSQIPKVIERLRQENGDIPIYAVGHSLGGGLAQQTGFLSRHITEVFTFNTSPVTNWTWLSLNHQIENEYPRIYRVFHTGEILEKVRFVTTNFTSTSYGRYDIGVQYESKSHIEGHSIKVITCKFACALSRLNEDDTSVEHHLPTKFVREELLGEGKMCEGILKNGAGDKCE